MSHSANDLLIQTSEVPVSQRVYDQIRESIISLEWKPGTRLSEKDVAAEIGVSKTPVREAFIRLSDEGLIEIRPKSGSYVSEISFEKVYESLMLRRAIELAVVTEAANRRTTMDLVNLQQLIERQMEAAEAGDGVAFFELDRDFHQALAHIAAMPSAIRLIHMVRGAVSRVQRLRISRGENRHDQVIEAHQSIVAAIENRDAVAASNAMDAHLNCVELFAKIIRSPDVQEHVASKAS